MKCLFTSFDSAAESVKEGCGFNCCWAENTTTTTPPPPTTTRSRKLGRSQAAPLITRQGDREAPPLYLVVSISHLTVNSAVKHQRWALYCLQAHLTIKLPLIFSNACRRSDHRGPKNPPELESHPPAVHGALASVSYILGFCGIHENIFLVL